MSSEFVIQVGLCRVQLLTGDITKIAVDAIVNAANSHLSGGGGVDGAIHRAAGFSIMDELNLIREQIGRCAAGSAVATGAGNLPAKWVFHAVGPRYRDGTHGEPEQLASCYDTCLQMAIERQVKSISFPSISTGVYAYPIAEATRICLQTITSFLRDKPGEIHTVKLVQFSDADHQVFRETAQWLRT